MSMNTITPTTPAQDSLVLLGRVLLAWLFIPAGWGKIAGFSGVVGYIASKGVPMPEVAAALAIVAELGLGLLLLVGWKAKWAALGLAVFVAVITPIFHAFWAVPEAQKMAQSQAFWKNIAVLGGLLVVTAFGPGRFSIDGRGRGEDRTGNAAYGGAR
jgi:putative oxidoreductase